MLLLPGSGGVSLTTRILLGILASLLVVVLATTGHGGVGHDETGQPTSAEGGR